MLDIHSHILPGIDDGATDEKEAIAMLKAARLAGIDKLVATPHVSRERDYDRYRDVYNCLQKKAEDIGIQLILGCELHVRFLADFSVSPERLAKYTIGKTNFILLEFTINAPPVDWEYMICDLNKFGYHVIIAHPERYYYVERDIGIAQALINYGCELQIDACSLLNSRFSPDRRIASALLDRGLSSYIASDAHKPSHFESFAKAFCKNGKNWPVDGLLNQYL